MFALSVLGPDGLAQHARPARTSSSPCSRSPSGRFVAFAADAVVYDEQPLTLEQSLWQRYRWSVGSVQVMRQQFGTLVRAGLHGRPSALDAALFIIGVPMGGVSALLWIAWLGVGLASGVTLGATVLSVLVSAVTGYLVLAGFAWLVVTLEHARWRGRTRALLGFPVWVFAWMVINLVVLFWRDPTWRVQPHTEDLSLDDVSVRMAFSPVSTLLRAQPAMGG